jgi:large subunit ribosomal protein L9
MKAIELLLTENVDNLGIVGDVVKVRPGYARNFLLPRLLATKPTPGAVKRLAERRKIVEAELKARRSVLEAMFEKLKAVEITMQRSANEQGVLFGGVSQHEIAEALRAEGFAIEDRMVRIGQVIKRLDSYPIPVVLASDLKAEIKLWVVSDKPLDQQEQQEQPVEQAQAEPAADEASAEDGGKKKKKSRKSKSEESASEKA